MNSSRSPIDVIDSRIGDLRRSRAEALQKIREIDIKLEELHFVRQAVAEASDSNVLSPPPEDDIPVGMSDLPSGPTEAIVAALASHPNGMSRDDIYDAVKNKMATEANNPKRLVFTILGNLKRRNRVRQNVSGKYFLMEEPAFRSDADKPEVQRELLPAAGGEEEDAKRSSSGRPYTSTVEAIVQRKEMERQEQKENPSGVSNP